MERISVISVTTIVSPKYVYNLRIKNNHNFYTNGVLCHNCDDPLSARDGNSANRREDAIVWWDQTMSTRLNNPKTDVKVIIMQRLHNDDLTGHVLEQGGYVHLCLPAEYVPSRKCYTSIGFEDPRTVEGELLWPAQVPQKELDNLKKVMGPQAYSAQYQQDPVPAGGAIFKTEWFRYFSQENQFYILHGIEDRKVLRTDCWLFATVDLAASKSNTADYTVITTWAVTPDNDILLLDLMRERLDGPEIEQAIKTCYRKWNHTYFKIEAVAFQLVMIQAMTKAGVPVVPYKPMKDKVSRAISASTFYANGQVYHMQFADYLMILENELTRFPKDSHDDCVDCVAMATEVVFDPEIPNIRIFDGEDEMEDLPDLVAKAMERGRLFDWGDV